MEGNAESNEEENKEERKEGRKVVTKKNEKGYQKRKGCKLKEKRLEKIQKKNGINQYKHLTESIYKSFDQ